MVSGVRRRNEVNARQARCKDCLQFKGLISLLATLSNNMDVFVIF